MHVDAIRWVEPFFEYNLSKAEKNPLKKQRGS
jgi:hypothetical protein